MLFGTRGDTYGDENSAERMQEFMTKKFRGVFPNWDNVDIEDIIATTVGDGYKIQGIIEGVVMSPAFRSP